MPERTNQFFILVRDMRSAQKDYFATKNREALSKAKSLEKLVDAQIAVIFDGVREQGMLA